MGEHSHRQDAVESCGQTVPPPVVGRSWASLGCLQGQVEACLGRHPDAEIYRSQPGLGEILGARVLGEFGDDPDRYQDV